MRARDYFFSFHGRINRARFWIYLAIVIPFLMFMMMAFFAYAMSVPGAYENGGPTPFPHGPIGIAIAILFFAVLAAVAVSGFAVSVKRLHDRDQSGWWVLVFIVLPNMLWAVWQTRAATMGGANVGGFAVLCGLAAFALSIWALIELGCLRGTAGDNRFGPDPLAN
ncbi:MAG TPA: DUF805 domain-containing protein [Rhizomicrobium sp.]|jgi:uncharacterized membrane protein YhaH (DUF805 family)|nr:DUF805 domain-containing protein [Rhizomicrobium sp.]